MAYHVLGMTRMYTGLCIICHTLVYTPWYGMVWPYPCLHTIPLSTQANSSTTSTSEQPETTPSMLQCELLLTSYSGCITACADMVSCYMQHAVWSLV